MAFIFFPGCVDTGTCSSKQSPELPDIVFMDHHLSDSSIRRWCNDDRLIFVQRSTGFCSAGQSLVGGCMDVARQAINFHFY